MVCPSFVVLSAGHMRSTLFLLQKWQFWWGFFFFFLFGLFVSFCAEFAPRCPGTQLFLVLYCFFVFCSLKRAVSRYKHCSRAVKSPRTQPGKDSESRGFAVIVPFHRHVIHTHNIHPPHTHTYT